MKNKTPRKNPQGGEPAFVYVLSNETHSALYTGSLACGRFYTWYQRIKYQPKSFEAPYVFSRLVYIEMFDNPLAATRRERQIKALSRIGQRKLVKLANENSEDLLETFAAEMERFRLV